MDLRKVGKERGRKIAKVNTSKAQRKKNGFIKAIQ
jgi:hypothetical protein